MFELLIPATLETLFMVMVSASLGFFLGTPLALYVWASSPQGLSPSPFLHRSLSLFVNAARSIPYIIFMVILIPITRFLVGTSIGTMAATVPLSLAAILIYTRFAEEVFQSLPKSLIEAGSVMAATRFQIVRKIVLSETLPQLMAHLTNLTVMLIGFSAMAGAVGGGGLGDLAIRYGYQRYDLKLLSMVVFILISLVQCVQVGGDLLVRKLRK